MALALSSGRAIRLATLLLPAAATILVGFATQAAAQTPSAAPTWEDLCDDCTGTEYFGELAAADTNDCQSYALNVFENWTAEGTSSPDPKFIAAAQTDIREVNEFSDANFWYYQVITRATSWSSVLVQSLNLELAFGDCTNIATRFNILASYTTTSADVGTTWRPQGNAQVKVYRDSDTGNNRIGDVTNDGPATPVAANTSNFDSDDNGYDTDVVVVAADVYTRLTTSGGFATIEIAIRRSSAALIAVQNPFTPCFGRAWTGQTSTIAKDAFAINDQRPTPDFSSTSWAVDNCAVAVDADPCDPAPDCSAFHTACGIASCDSNGDVGNCDTLTPRTTGTVCRTDAGECDVAETCDGTNTGACPADAFEAGGTSCGSGVDTICDNPDTCNGSGTCLTNNAADGTLCRSDAGECDIQETCLAGACPADAFEPVDTTCGSGADTICDDPDTCDGSGTCDPNNEPGTTVCRADAGECDVQETCAAGVCPADAFEPIDTACGSGADTICDNPDTCNGSGTCTPNNEPGSTVCRADTGDCDIEETCAAGVCPADAFEAPDTACGSNADTICDNPDTCSGSGTCEPNHEPGSTVCRTDAGECDVEETCLAGTCPADAFEPVDTACGSGSDTICDEPDTCDGNGTCDPNNEPGSTVCRADAGDCDVEETCVAGDCPADAFEPEDTACGSSADTICDDPDTCDANGTCETNNEPGSTVCRADAGDCDVEESCVAGDCPADAFEDADTECGSAADTICDDPDTCDGNGTCEPNHAPGSTVCRADAGDCDIEETCVAGDCPADAFEAVDTACGSGADTICDDPDTCDGSGTCEPNNATGATVCRTDAGECDVEETCVAGDCPADAFEPVDTACGSSGDTICDDADSCDGNGTCLVNNQPGSTVCRAAVGDCDVEETCDGIGDCPGDAFVAEDEPCGSGADTICDDPDTCDGNGTCEPNNAPGSTVCRTDAGDCDVEETCVAGDCPADAFEPEDTACGSGTNTDCDNPDSCDGNGTCEPNYEPSTTECRGAADVCDVAESCDGSGACPDDGFAGTSTVCRPAADLCDVEETCDGAGPACPGNDVASAGTECRGLAGSCDVAETCDGSTIACPADDVLAAATSCRPIIGSCDVEEVCDGSNAACPDDAVLSITTTCRGTSGVCDAAENCTGSSGECPGDGYAAAGTTCRTSVSACDATETCTGGGIECPADGPLPNGTSCEDGNACTTSDSCQSGACEAGDPLVCEDVDLCTIDSCDEQLGCQYDPWIRDIESCVHGAAGRMVVLDRTLERKDAIRWTWRKGEPTVAEQLFGTPGSGTGFSLCVFDQSGGTTRIATSLAIPPDAPYWKPPKPGRARYINRQGVFDGVRRMRLQASTTPGRSKVMVRAKGETLPLPVPATDSAMFTLDPTLVVQLVNDEGACWSNEFMPEDTRRNTPVKYRAVFR